MGKINRKFIGLSQYRAPLCHELAGKHFHLVMDGDKDYSVYFLDGENVQIATKGEPYIWESYECLKADDTTYFVHVMPESGKGLINYTLVLDTAQRLVTFVLMEEGFDPEYPRLIRTTPFFGAIKVPGRELPTIRHHLSKKMVGHHIFWHYNPGFAIQHIYHDPITCRASAGNMDSNTAMRSRLSDMLNSEDPAVREQAEATLRRYEERAKFYPFYEEECFHIWINDHLNLFCFVEENMTLCAPNHDYGGGGILLLQDTERLVDYGLSFCAGEYYLCTAYGDENEDGDPLDTAESPYDWSKLHSMPSIHWPIPDED